MDRARCRKKHTGRPLPFRSPADAPLLVSSTTVMSFPALIGEPGVRAMVAAPEPGARTTNVSVLEREPSGFCRSTVRFPSDCKSAALNVVVHWTLDAQEVVRAVPATRNVEAGPGLDGEKLLPEASRVNPPAEPAYELVGEMEKISGLAVIVTAAVPDWVVSAELVATTSMRAGEGTAGGAVYSPVESTDPQAPTWPQPVPAIAHVTWGLFVPVTLAVNCKFPLTPIDPLLG